MKKPLLMMFSLLFVGVSGVLLHLLISFPKVAPADIFVVDKTVEAVERGKYLAHHVAVCIDCHSTRDWTKFSGPIIPGTLGKGGEAFTKELGFPGNFYARNITPVGIGDWSDGEVIRAFTSGVSKAGRPFFPVMPYLNYGKMAKSDAASIVAYLRTLSPLDHTVPNSQAGFPINLILRTLPQNADFATEVPTTSDTLAYGQYMTTLASCGECHTQNIKGKKVEGMEFAGGFKFPLPSGVVQSANITPDNETGIGAWSMATFIARFKAFDPEAGYTPQPIGPKAPNTVMPWTMYAGMTEEDLGAIYTYLQTLKPVKNKVPRLGATELDVKEAKTAYRR